MTPTQPQPARATKWYRRPSVWLGLLLSSASVVFLLAIVDVNALIADLRQADLRLVLAGFIMICLSCYLRTFRWQAILRPGVPYWKVFHADNIGYVTNSLLPLRAGEAARAYVISRTQRIPFVEAFSTVVVARLTDMIATVALLGLVLPALDVPNAVKAGGLSLLIVAGGALIVLIVGAFARDWMMKTAHALLPRLLPARLAKPLLALGDDFLRGLTVLRDARRLVWLLASLVVLWASYLSFYGIIMAAVWPSPPIAWPILAAAAAALGTAVPSSPAFVGVFHVAVAVAMEPFLSRHTAVAYAIIAHATEFVCTLVFGFYSLTVTGTSLWRVGAAAEEMATNAATAED